MHGVMAPPMRHPSRPLMLAAGTPLQTPRGLMSTDAAAFVGVGLHGELRRLLWSAAVALAIVLYLIHDGAASAS